MVVSVPVSVWIISLVSVSVWMFILVSVSVEHYPVLMPSFEEMCEVLSLYTILVYRHNNIPIELTVNFHKAVSYIAILSKKYYSLRLRSLLINTWMISTYDKEFLTYNSKKPITNTLMNDFKTQKSPDIHFPDKVLLPDSPQAIFNHIKYPIQWFCQAQLQECYSLTW